MHTMYIGKDIPQPYYMGMQSLIGFASSEITNNRENLLMQCYDDGDSASPGVFMNGGFRAASR